MFKKLIVLSIISFGMYQNWQKFPFARAKMPSMQKQNGIDPASKRGRLYGGGTVRHIPFERVKAKEFDFPQLATPEIFTVVDFTSETCATCVALETAYHDLVRKRSDVQVIRIDLPSQMGGFQTDNAAEFERLKKKLEDDVADFTATLDRFELCGTPHVVILDPNKKVFRGDRCTNKSGLDALKAWLSRENISW